MIRAQKNCQNHDIRVEHNILGQHCILTQYSAIKKKNSEINIYHSLEFSVPYNLALQYFSFRVNAQHRDAQWSISWRDRPPPQFQGGGVVSCKSDQCVRDVWLYVRVVVFMKDATLHFLKKIWAQEKLISQSRWRENKKRGSPCRSHQGTQTQKKCVGVRLNRALGCVLDSFITELQ